MVTHNLSYLINKHQTPQETIAAKRTAAYRARKRTTDEGTEELKAKGRENSRRYRLKKKAMSAPITKRHAMTSAQRTAAYRARKRMTQEGVDELRAKGRVHMARLREKKQKQKSPRDHLHLKPCDGYDCQPPDVSDACKSLMSAAPHGFDTDGSGLDAWVSVVDTADIV